MAPKRKTGNKRGGGGNAPPRHPKICGPALIQTLRGRLHGRDVAFVCCGESHEDAIDLTRSRCIVEPKMGWVRAQPPAGMAPDDEAGLPGFDPEEAIARQGGLTLEGAKSWAERLIDKMDDDSDEEDEFGGFLVYEPQGGAKARGTARLFSEDAEWSAEHRFAVGTVVLQWADLDPQARDFNQRRLNGEEVPIEEHDALIAERKVARAAEKLELFDDWLLRHMGESNDGAFATQLLLEAPVSWREVELHVEPDALSSIPPAHECLRRIELDSDEDSDDEDDPDDGTGSFLDYLKRRVEASVPDRVHAVDPRELGDDDAQIQQLHGLLTEPLPPDAEVAELDSLKAEYPVESGSSADEKLAKRQQNSNPDHKPPVPSWEAYFGAASELLYYSPYIKADYTPFLAKCVGDAASLRRFFQALYFGTVPEALAQLKTAMSPEIRSFTRLRSLAYRGGPGSKLWRRPSDQGTVPVKAAPVDRYLKAKGSDPPRTWVSGIGQRVREAGAAELVNSASAWFAESVERLLVDPKDADPEGDYFVSWLRECHRNIYDDVDITDPKELKGRAWAESEEHPGSKKHRYNIKDIRIPDVEAAFAELAKFDGSAPSTRRERVLAKIMVDIFQLRMVDLASILRAADVALSTPEGSRIVIVYYAGVDHVRSFAEFWTAQGFSSRGLSDDGLVGKEDWEDDEPRGLELPDYLRDFGGLFPVPQ